MVINSLTDGKSTHIPYRDSKLTRVLQESIGGNSKTSLLITCSPSIYNDLETISTLRFGLRAKKIKNKPKINKEVTLSELKLEIERLEREFNKCIKRISQLEKYITLKGLQIPDELDINFENVDNKNKEDSIENNENLISIEEENKKLVLQLEEALLQINDLNSNLQIKVFIQFD